MSGNTTSNSSALRRAEVYSSLILDEIKDGFLPDGLHRDVSDFGDGDTLNITTFGEAVLRDIAEDQPIPVDAIDTGRITLSITEHVGAGVYLTDELKEDSWQSAQFDSIMVPKMLRAIQERYETDLLSQQSKQTAGDANAVNDYAHRFCASGTTRVLSLDDLIYLKLAFDKANMPNNGRILIVDPLVEGTLNGLMTTTNATSYNPQFEGIVNTGFANNMRFIRNIFGFDIYVSNRLPKLTAQETLDTTGGVAAPSGNDNAEIGDVVNQAWCVADDMTTPIMGAWRKMPQVEGDRNVPYHRDEFYTRARWGFGLQRPQSIVSLITNGSTY